jgi:hypothetical protein
MSQLAAQVGAFIPMPQELGDTFSSIGAEALIYEDANEPDRYLIKKFHDEHKIPRPLTGDKALRLRELFNMSATLRPSEWHFLVRRFSWAVEVYGSAEDVIDGVKIPKASEDFFIDFENVFESKRSLQNLGFLHTDFLAKPTIIKTPFTEVVFDDRVEICYQFMLAFGALWETGYRYCDFSANNLAWSLKPIPRVFIIDAESCREPGLKATHSPDWAPAPNLGETMEGDRSLCGLLVWRILSVDYSLPIGTSSPRYVGQCNAETRQLICDLFTTGSGNSFEQLKAAFAEIRAKKWEDESFEWACESGFARLVLSHAPLQPNSKQQKIIEAALDQVELEDTISLLDARSRALKLFSSQPLPGFEFDINQGLLSSWGSQSEVMLRELAFSGLYTNVAERVLASASTSPVDGITYRAIEHALVEVGLPVLQYTPNGPTSSTGRYEWAWPGSPLVTHAECRFVTSSGNIVSSHSIDRSTKRPLVTFSAAQLRNEPADCELRFGLKLASGEIVYSPVAATIYIPGVSKGSVVVDGGGIKTSLVPRVWVPPQPRPVPTPTAKGEFDGPVIAGEQGEKYKSDLGGTQRSGSVVTRLLSIWRRLSNRSK